MAYMHLKYGAFTLQWISYSTFQPAKMGNNSLPKVILVIPNQQNGFCTVY